jgi:glutamyl-tRNA reductase
MTTIGTPLSASATKVLFCGAGELGKEVALELQRYGVEVIALVISKVNNKLKNYKNHKNPYKLSRIFEKIPAEVLNKYNQKDLILKKCTI